MRCREILLVFLVLEGLQANDDPCVNAKKKGYKVTCPPWTDPNCAECEWFEFISCDGICGGGIKKESRSRICTYLDEDKNRKMDCMDAQERKSKCQMQCGLNGKYNDFLDFCECNENFGGTCCDEKIEACTNPVMKQGEVDRSIVTVGKGNRCDARLRPNWYSFDSPAGNLMPTECVAYGHCNTAVPFWMNGTHPGPRDGVVERWACGTQGEDCCKHKLKIKVRNCGKYMAYYLVPTQGCMKAYCIGSNEKCPEGESSDTGFQPGCTDQFPDVKVNPVMGYEVDESTKRNEISLTCSATHKDAIKYLWKVQWFFDGEPGPIQKQDRPSPNPQPKFYLPSTAWAHKMGTMAQCVIQAKQRDGVGTWSRDETKSTEYYLGIIVEEKVVNVKEGEAAHVTLRPTLPVRCSSAEEAANDCKLVMAISMDPTQAGPRCPGKQPEISQVIFQGDMETHCGFKDIHHKNWHLPSKLKIKPKLDIQLDGNQIRTLRLRVHEELTGIPDIWKGYHLPTVQINILDTDDRGTCSMVNDPHITTFDNRKYDFHGVGNGQDNRQIYVAYKHTKESEEVQARFVHCSGNYIYCICGVAIRAGASTVVFDKCRTNPSLHPEINYQVKNAVVDPRMRVFKHNSGTLYHVFLPTGTQVKIYNAGGNTIWFEIKASVDSKKQVVGLCGDYNGDPKDDLRNSQNKVVCPHYNTWYNCQDQTFRGSWRVAEGDSIFSGNVPPHNPGEIVKELYCDCISEPDHHGYEDCDYHKRYEPCDDGYEIVAAKKGYSQSEFPWLMNFMAPQHQNPAYAKAAASAESQYYSGWAAQTWTDQAAKEFCTKTLFSSPAITSCLNEVPNQDYTTNIEACALDLVLTGSTDFASTHVEAVKSQCNQELRMNLDLWEPRDEESGTGGEEKLVVGPPLRLMENLCPNECSGQGACIDGKCFCKKGYSSYDCSLKVDEIPVVKGVSSSPVPCDRSNQDCSVIALEGLKYLEGPKLTCHYYKAENDGKYFYSGPSAAPSVQTLPATLFSLWVVQCDVPEPLSSAVNDQTTLYQLQVSVSNDGEKQSDRAYYGSYDGTCEQCVGKTCTKKEDSCIIKSQCYGFGEGNPANDDEVCNPGVNGFGWSSKSSLTSPTTPETTTTERITTTTRGDDVDIVCNLKPGEVSVHRDPKNCSWYYVCEGNIKHHMPCPGGLAFSEEKGKCLDPKEVPGC